MTATAAVTPTVAAPFTATVVPVKAAKPTVVSVTMVMRMVRATACGSYATEIRRPVGA
jgi:hypothetical protein